MTEAAQRILQAFGSLSERDRREVALEILRQTALVDTSSVGDTELLAAADAVFLELDRAENNG